MTPSYPSPAPQPPPQPDTPKLPAASAAAAAPQENLHCATADATNTPTVLGTDDNAHEATSTTAVEPPTLATWLSQPGCKFALALAPCFFGFYAHIGALKALEEAGLLGGDRVSFACGASAGALVAGLFASGLTASDMQERALRYQRRDFWDPVGVGGVLRGRALEAIFKESLPPGVSLFEHCRVPLGMTGFSLSALATRTMTSGDVALAMRASCTFPVLFQPVWHPQGVLMDGGVMDTAGLWAVPDEGEDHRRILNITFSSVPELGIVPPSSFPSRLRPRKTPHPKEVVSLVLRGLPRPHPFAMHKGQRAIDAAYAQVKAVLSRPMEQGEEPGHWLPPTHDAVGGDGGGGDGGGGDVRSARGFSRL